MLQKKFEISPKGRYNFIKIELPVFKILNDFERFSLKYIKVWMFFYIFSLDPHDIFKIFMEVLKHRMSEKEDEKINGIIEKKKIE